MGNKKIAAILCLLLLSAAGCSVSRNTETDPVPETEAVTTAAVIETELPTTVSLTTEPPITTEAPTETEAPGRLAGIRIGLDPGHQAHGNSEQEPVSPGSSQMKAKVSSGAVGVSTGIPEYITVLEIAQQLKADLEEEGAVVCMTRESHDVDISNIERAAMMNEAGVDLMLRIHCDGSDDHSTSGVALFVSESNAIAEQSRIYAEIMEPIICDALDANNRGVTQNDNYTGQNWAEVPCIMIECGFLSNPEEDQLLNDPAYQKRLADAVTEGIAACFADTPHEVESS